jgi:hypothetical protein
MLPTKFPFIGESGFRGEDFLEINLLPMVASPLTNTVQQAILVSDWLISRKSSLKSIGQMNRSLIGSIYGMSSITIDYFIPIR